MQIRRTLAVGALSAIAFAGFASTPANADSHLSRETVADAVVAAKENRDQKKAAFTEYKNTPWGQLVKAERAEARAEVRSSERTIKALVKEAKSEKGAARKESVQQIKAEHKDVARAERELSSKKALRAAIQAERKTLKSEWEAAEQELREARRFQEACNPETETDVEDEVETGGDATGEGTQA